ncbi:MAG: aminotransferase class I/II-fold pyridoxal phosphate-dependent enzyme [Verrucomicrobiota bacterium]
MQSPHGGNIDALCQRFGVAAEDALDFSSNLNWFLPPVDDDTWLKWKDAAHNYGDASSNKVSSLIASLFGYEEKQVLATAGAIEAIYLCAQLFQERRVLIGAPGFADYTRAFQQSEVKTWNLDPDDPILDWAEVVIFGSPNNPTGVRVDIDSWRARWPGKIWLIDETFVEFSQHPPTAPAEDLILFRTLTKSWRIPGLRLGFLLTLNLEWMSALENLQPPWSLNSVAQAWAADRLNRSEQLRVEESIAAQIAERDRFMNLLGALPQLRVHPSEANFFLIELIHGKADQLLDFLGSCGIFVRECESFEGLDGDRFLRLAVRLPQENDRLLQSIRNFFTDE